MQVSARSYIACRAELHVLLFFMRKHATFRQDIVELVMSLPLPFMERGVLDRSICRRLYA